VLRRAGGLDYGGSGGDGVTPLICLVVLAGPALLVRSPKPGEVASAARTLGTGSRGDGEAGVAQRAVFVA
jgi:hypothetical protein